MRIRFPAIALDATAVLTLGAMFWFAWNRIPTPHVEPDRFYHLALSRLLAESTWLPRSFPPAEDIGWAADFPERYWLYHLLQGLAWKLSGGASGVFLLAAGIGGMLPVAVYGVLRKFQGPLASFLLASGTFAAAPFPMLIAPAMRPVNLAFLLLLALVGALLHRRPLPALLAALLGALTYHAFYLPAAVIFGFWVAYRKSPRPELFAALGLLIGILANPYFPHPVIHGLMMALVGARVTALPENLPLGQELRELPFLFLLQNLAPGLAVVAWAALGNKREASTVALAIPAFLFLALALRQARAIDFFLPFAAFLAASALRERPRWAAAAGALALVLQVPGLVHHAREVRTGEGGLAAMVYFDRSMRAASEAFPPEAKGKKIFNCNWTAGAYLSWYQPEMRFVDLLDPSHLWFAHPAKYRAKEAIVGGGSPRPVEAIRDIFKAQYVLCDGQPLNRQLKSLGLKPFYSDRFSTEIFKLP